MTGYHRRRLVETESRTWGAILESALDDDGVPPCQPGACGTCDMFRGPRAGETWREWARRLEGDRSVYEQRRAAGPR